MSKQLHDYSSGHGAAGISSRYGGDGMDAYNFEPSLRFTSSTADAARYASMNGSASALSVDQGDGSRFRGADAYRDGALGAGQSGYSHFPWGRMQDFGASSVADTMIAASFKRQSEALYHLGAHNNTGQSEALFSTNSLVKRPRIETASHLPVYPQRPGEKDCAHYMLTRTCKFGDACKFDHPLWVPEGGIPDWKEVPNILTPDVLLLPERPGEPDCPFYMKTHKCKFGNTCKFNHPKVALDVSVLPERPSEPICSYYSKTGKCKFGAICIFNHPKDLEIPSNEEDQKNVDESAVNNAIGPFTPALLHNSKGLPIRPGEQDCPFYLKTGSCKYSVRCRYNHPDRNAINPQIPGTIGSAVYQSPNIVNSSISLLPNIDPRLTQAQAGLMMGSAYPQYPGEAYPQRPGEPECDFYMKTGKCKFVERCKFHHPIDRSVPAVQPPVKLTLAGFPRHEGSIICPFYMRTGTCKYAAACRYDHPPPGEVMAKVTSQSAGTQSAEAAADTAREPENITNGAVTREC